MVSFKFVKMFIAVMITVAMGAAFGTKHPCIDESTISAQQAHNYSGHVIDTLFVPTLHDGEYARELYNWGRAITKQILQNEALYVHQERNHMLVRRYNRAKLYEALLNESVDFIEEKSVEYAQKELKKFPLASRFDKHAFAQRIAHNIVDKVHTLISESVTLNAGVFMNFVGAPLRSKVYKLVKKELA
jgi:hypothetical protein